MRRTAAIVCLSAFASVASASTNLLPVWSIDSGFYNDLGGGYNHFSSGGSTASLHFDSGARRGDGGRSLRATYCKADDGYCGFWIHLFDEKAEPAARRLVDASGYSFLSMWVKGAKGGEDFTIQMADATWLAKDDSKPAGKASRYLGGPLTADWQELLIPLEDFGLDAARLGGLTVNFTEQGEGTVYFDDVSFKRAVDVETPLAAAPAAGPGATSTLARAMWVWEADVILPSEQGQQRLLDFCGQSGVDELFFQVLYGWDGGSFYLKQTNELRRFVGRCNAAGIKVHALDGYPEYALLEFHREVLALVNALIDFNRNSEAGDRLYGIHLDNEPYQLTGFDGPDRGKILKQFLVLNEKVAALLREKKSDLAYGVDIPFWLDEKNDALLRQLLGCVDNIGVMDYRNFAGGVDGIIHHVLGEMDEARRAGKKLYIGVETFRYEPTPVLFLYGPPEELWQTTGGGTVAMKSAMGGFKMRTFADGRRRYIGLAQSIPPKDPSGFAVALTNLYARCNPTPAGDPDLKALDAAAEEALRRQPDYRGFEPFVLRNPAGRLLAAGFKTTEVMLDKITFAGKSKPEMEAVLKEVAEFFRADPAFAGFAIHHYTTYRAMPD